MQLSHLALTRQPSLPQTVRLAYKAHRQERFLTGFGLVAGISTKYRVRPFRTVRTADGETRVNAFENLLPFVLIHDFSPDIYGFGIVTRLKVDNFSSSNVTVHGAYIAL